MIVIAHRGASQEFFENSWPAFNRAVELGCHRIELDLHLSKDGEVFILHDNDMQRLLSLSSYVDQMLAKDLKLLRLKNGTPLPRLTEVLSQLAPKIELNLELKGENLDLTAISARKVQDSGYQNAIIFSSFYVPHLAYLRDHAPMVKRALLWSDEDTLLADGSHPKNPWPLMEELKTNIIHPEVANVTPQFMQKAKSKGYLVYPWISAVDEPLTRCQEIWENLKQLKVDGLCTNHPKEMLEWLKQ